MNARVKKLRDQSFSAKPSISAERAVLSTECYKEWSGKVSVPVLRALNFKYLCEKKTIYIGEGELIVGERGPYPKAVSTFPELNCHSLEDLRTLDSRPMAGYSVSAADIDAYRELVIPYWRGRSIRDRAFGEIGEDWKGLYEAGVFTEFMEQRAPGHTALDGTIYRKGTREFKAEIARARAAIDWALDKEALAKDEELRAMDIACDAAALFANRHAELAASMAGVEADPVRASELRGISEACARVALEAPRNFQEALQAYWFAHLGTITELNGWDAMSPGHLDLHLAPFYERGIADGSLSRESAKELLSCFWIKVNNTPAPPKVGVTAAESGTYNDFTNINLGGLKPDGSDASNEVSYITLEVLDELKLLQPQANVQLSAKTPERLLKAACRVIREGLGYPSLFNADEVVTAQIGMGKSIVDAREGGTSGCVETGCFGKEAYLLHGYLNVPKVLELTLHDGIDPLSGKQVGIKTGDPAVFSSFEELWSAFERQLDYVVSTKVRVSNYLDRMFASYAPAPYLSVLVADCVKNGKDYYNGGARYNTDYIQTCGLATTTDSLTMLQRHVFGEKTATMAQLVAALDADWKGHERLRLLAVERTPKFGNDEDEADRMATRLFSRLRETIEGRFSPRGGSYRMNVLSTTCHVYFGLRTGATPDGRHSRMPESDGASPAQGADRAGPTAVIKSMSKLDHALTGGTLLNMRFLPTALAGDGGIDRLAALIRTYFRLGGHHVQFNVVDTATLRAAQAKPEAYRDLMVRVAGYSDYFVDLDRNHQEEIVSRTAQEEV